MRMTLPLLLVATLTVTGCARVSESRLNPLNWFGNSQAAPLNTATPLRPLTPSGQKTQVVDSRGAIQSISTLTLERTPDGAIIRATGIASTQGQFNAQLVPVSTDNGVLTLIFRIEAVAAPQTNSSTYSRQVTTARTVSFADLQDIRTILVQSATNARSVSR